MRGILGVLVGRRLEDSGTYPIPCSGKLLICLPPIHLHEHLVGDCPPRSSRQQPTTQTHKKERNTIMNRKLTLALASTFALAATSAFAQMTTTETTTTSTSPVAESTTVETTSYNPGSVIMDSTGTRVGTIERVIERKA